MNPRAGAGVLSSRLTRFECQYVRSPHLYQTAFGALGVLERLDEREQRASVGAALARLLVLAFAFRRELVEVAGVVRGSVTHWPD